MKRKIHTLPHKRLIYWHHLKKHRAPVLGSIVLVWLENQDEPTCAIYDEDHDGGYFIPLYPFDNETMRLEEKAEWWAPITNPKTNEVLREESWTGKLLQQ